MRRIGQIGQNAQLDVTDKREGRIAVLEEGAKRELELWTTAVARLGAETITDAAAYRIVSLYLDTKVRLLRERGPNDKVVAQIKALQKEQVEHLTTLVKLVEDQYGIGATGTDAFVSAETALVNAQVNAADTAEAKILVLTNAAKKETDFLKIVEARFQAGTITQAEVCRARSVLLDSKIRLLRERGLQKVQDK